MSAMGKRKSARQRKEWLESIVGKAKQGSTAMSDAMGRAALLALSEMHQEAQERSGRV